MKKINKASNASIGLDNSEWSKITNKYLNKDLDKTASLGRD